MTYPASTGQTPRFEIFPWSHHFNTGIEVIDAQHRQLVFLLNQMAEYVIEGASEAELKALIDELADYAQYHFSTEEAIWAQAFAQESSFADHCHIHQEFSRKVLALQAEQASLHCALDDIFGFLTHWLAFHILDSDKRMALTLKAVESGESLPRAKQLAAEEMSGTLSALIDAVLSMYRNLSERTLDLMREKKARGQAEDALRDLESQVLERSQHRYEVLFNSIPDAVFVADILTGQLIGANTQAEAIIGLKLQEIQQLHFTDLHPDSAKAENERHFSELLKHPGEIRVFETQLLHSSGRCIEVEIHAGGRYREGEASAMVALMRDITQRREQAAEKDAALQRLQEAERIAGVGHWHYDWQKDQLQASDEVFRLLESSVETFAGNFQAFVNAIHPEDQNAFTQVFADSLTQSDLIGECEHRVQSATGAVRYVKERFEHQANAAGAVLFTTGTIQDITSSVLYQQKLEYLAFHDSLTALYNRVGISRYLDQRLQAAPQTPLAVVYLDLDNFSEVNNRLGDLCGDELLREVALRLRCFVQDQEGLARPGGDEFVLILERAQEDEHFIQRLEQLLDHLREPYELQGQPHLSQVSAGISFYPQTLEVSADTLIRQADQAMYLAKVQGKNTYAFFDSEHEASRRSWHQRRAEIEVAIAENQFVLYYQPKVNMRTGELLSLEALIRWQHPEKGLLPPGAFLPDIENDSISLALGEWVIAQALNEIASWQTQGVAIKVSVNIGSLQFQSRDFPERLQSLLAACPGVAAEALELEILESSALEDWQLASATMHACLALGVSLSLDDFGTGYSSLSYLKRLPAQTLKIDRAFVQDMLDDPDDLAILEGVVGLANAFRRNVLAEGVETLEQGEMLIQLGCEWAQGYAIAKPMPADQVLPWWEQWLPDASWRRLQPVRRDKLAVLFAIVEHRAWIRRLQVALKQQADWPPMDPTRCRFGQWLAKQSGTTPEEVELLKTLQYQHLNIHQFAAELKAQPQRYAAEEASLYAYRDQLVETLKLYLMNSST
ncbi:bacteriohemerythrin [Nitrincola tapanii]|uniref:Bacteriohemerythrin n=1 Tax=Nitrincola tapanii TaxID=1708751 RepID=A0A5A9W215_9GAMM|nr:bacteriohemerythrin [Nitrincola tapanii]KAA0874148.1 bacteriohemerythrin [Nitrincola tapanii]